MPDTETLRPNALGNHQEWDLSDTTHYGATSDQSDSTYIYTGLQDEKDTQNLADPTFGELDTINSVTIWARLRATGSKAGEKANTLIITHGTEYLGTGVTIDRGIWEDISTEYLLNPYTETAWTKAEVTNLEAGVQVTTLGSGEQMDCSEIWVVVDYTAAGGQEYVIDLTNPINVDYSEILESNFEVKPGFQPNIQFEKLVQIDFNIALDFQPSISFLVDVVKTMAGGIAYAVDLTWQVTTSFTADVITGMQHITDLSFNPTISYVAEVVKGILPPNPNDPNDPLWTVGFMFGGMGFILGALALIWVLTSRREEPAETEEWEVHEW